MTDAPTPIRLGTRASRLAVAQSQDVADRLAAASGRPVELVTVTSEGDTNRASLASLGGTGVFASALREALVAGEVDVLVHSLKDLPTAPYPGLTIAAVPKRADARDVLVARNGATVESLPEGAKVGTGSPRRVAQLKAKRPDLDVIDIRGNIDTRLGRVDDDLDAVVLAAAGLTRIDRLSAATELLDLGFWPSAPGQGALAIETRAAETDTNLLAALRKIEHAPTRLTVSAEREVLAKLEAGCSAPIGATAVVDAELLLVSATVYSPDGAEYRTASHAAVLEGSAQDRLAEALEVGGRVAAELLENGAGDLADLTDSVK
ncbi:MULTISPECIES: hydroxymethylbilane synthase [unclassified Curtobacterium]|uniref:hydroxymethylbilane synthase n=1 Tax=unclassified Curtobacterium TaxID=257496 RepID=UPI001051EF92|nr:MULTISPECIES: hydroxymethylbilane synthase [unclassified Curtobacterium]TCL77072.1 hydroxymethylbilane synthase [Curtobacterium sp. PhB128]TCL92650.1 hydroxymethylbilane synthase [Curtobacterium sp. PhB138]TCU50188.1 hydroxymethylbilane synthase [Curtobacterium sp. PhB146]TCU83096.1 hydroxymethylbilane synthase [Curtobacterium sp. PhB191]